MREKDQKGTTMANRTSRAGIVYCYMYVEDYYAFKVFECTFEILLARRSSDLYSLPVRPFICSTYLYVVGREI